MKRFTAVGEDPGAQDVRPPATETGCFYCGANALSFCNFFFGRSKEKVDQTSTLGKRGRKNAAFRRRLKI